MMCERMLCLNVTDQCISILNTGNKCLVQELKSVSPSFTQYNANNCYTSSDQILRIAHQQSSALLYDGMLYAVSCNFTLFKVLKGYTKLVCVFGLVRH